MPSSSGSTSTGYNQSPIPNTSSPVLFNMEGAAFATVPDLPQFQTLINASQTQNGLYDFYAMESTYVTDYHTLPMPVASNQVTACFFAVVAQPTQKRRVTWQAQKWGEWPTVPRAESSDENEVLLSDIVVTTPINLAANSTTQIYTLSGEFVYGLADPTKTTYYSGKLPYTNIPFNDTKVPESVYQGGITSPTGPPADD